MVKALQPSLETYPLSQAYWVSLTPLQKWYFTDLLRADVFIVEEPVSMHAAWTSIYTWLAGGMKPATCPVWSVTTWTQTSGVMCPLCLSLWQPMQEQCTMEKYTFQASHSSNFRYKVHCSRHLLDPDVSAFHRGCAQWRICAMVVLLWPCHGCLGPQTRHEHKTCHPHFGCDEWSLICNWRKSFERCFLVCCFCFVLILSQ